MPAVAGFLDTGIEIALKIKADSIAANPKAKLTDFIKAMGEPAAQQEIRALKEAVEVFCERYPTIGFDRSVLESSCLSSRSSPVSDPPSPDSLLSPLSSSRVAPPSK